MKKVNNRRLIGDDWGWWVEGDGNGQGGREATLGVGSDGQNGLGVGGRGDEAEVKGRGWGNGRGVGGRGWPKFLTTFQGGSDIAAGLKSKLPLNLASNFKNL